jgi:hypothetical protein
MRIPWAIFISLFLALLAISCSKAITVVIINRSGTDINVEEEGKWVSCVSGQMASFIPEIEKDHDIAILVGSEKYLYRLTNCPSSFLDVSRNKRLLFVFNQGHQLYILTPTNDPLVEDIGVQPTGYPLISK